LCFVWSETATWEIYAGVLVGRVRCVVETWGGLGGGPIYEGFI